MASACKATHSKAPRFGNHLSQIAALTEKGEPLKGAGDKPNLHDILTGSPPDGYANAADHKRSNFACSAHEGSASVGHFDRTDSANTAWNRRTVVGAAES